MKTVSRNKRKQLEKNPYGAPAKVTTTGEAPPISAPFGVLNASKSVPQVLSEEALIDSYVMCTTNKHCVDAGLHNLHNPEVWRRYYVRQNPGMKQAMRALVQIQTIQALLRTKYYIEDGEKENVEGEESTPSLRSVRLSRKQMIAPAFASLQYTSDHVYTMLRVPSQEFDTVIRVVAGDCLDVALSPIWIGQGKGKEPLVLDMASMSMPGGGWRKASAAQEENLHRRTNLMHCLEDPYKVNPRRSWDYPIPQFGGVYIPGVTVFRGSEPEGYPFLPEPRQVSVVACAALKMPPTEKDPKTGEERLDKKLARETLRKIEAILAIAVEHGHTDLVLSAFGCGAYMNPPGHIARLFRQALTSPTFKTRFENVIFAILDTPAPHSSSTPHSDSKTHGERHTGGSKEEKLEKTNRLEYEDNGDPSQASTSASSSSTPQASISESKTRTTAASVEKIDHSTVLACYPKCALFAQAFGVDVMNPDGSVLYKATQV